MKRILIKNGYLVNPGANQEGFADILLRDGKIEKIEFLNQSRETGNLPRNVNAENTENTGISGINANTEKYGVAEAVGNAVKNENALNSAEEITIFDAGGMYVFPGLVDAHSHFRDPGFTHKEDIFTGAKAAAAGGYTDVVLMCNTKPVVDTVETLKYVLEKGRQTDIHVHSCGTVSMGLKGTELTDMDALKAAGAVGFTDDGIPLMDPEFLERAMVKAAELGCTVSLHEEDKTMISNNGINRGKASQFYGIGGSPKEAEISLIQRDLEIALRTGVSLDVQHVSAKESVELIRNALRREALREVSGGENGDKQSGGERRIHAEATPQHFTLTEDAVIEIGADAKLNPPLRTEEDRLGIIEGLRDNTIDLIATDHAPHAPEEKNRPITDAPSGMLGLETALSLSYEKLVLEAEIPLSDVIAKLTCNPAKVYGLDAGTLKVGGAADLCIFDPNAEYIVEKFESKSVNSPFLGRKMKGKVICTVCGGKVVYHGVS